MIHFYKRFYLNMSLHGVGGAVQLAKNGRFSHLIVRFQQWGCSNRPFYHIVVDKISHPNRKQIDYIEQVGTYDPMTNAHNEKLVALNLERIQSYIAGGVQISRPVAQLLGISGLLPQHPDTYITAWRNRQAISNPDMRRDNVVLRHSSSNNSGDKL